MSVTTSYIVWRLRSAQFSFADVVNMLSVIFVVDLVLSRSLLCLFWGEWLCYTRASMFIHRIIQTGSSYRGAWPWRA